MPKDTGGLNLGQITGCFLRLAADRAGEQQATHHEAKGDHNHRIGIGTTRYTGGPTHVSPPANSFPTSRELSAGPMWIWNIRPLDRLSRFDGRTKASEATAEDR